MAYKKYSDSTLLSLPKKELLEHLRCAEHNRDVAEQALEQQAENFKNFMHLAMCDWISVEDEMPALVPCNAGTAYSEAVAVLTADRKIVTAVWDGEEWIGDFDYWEAERCVTHWKWIIPLPEVE